MAKNHYVSQLIIRRFSNAINTFDTKLKQLVKDRKSHNVFYKRGLYSDEIEKKMANQLEKPFAELIDKKILNKDKITLKRKELLLVKRFLLLDSIRTFSAEEFYQTIFGFKDATKRYFDINKNNNEQGEKLPSISEKKEDKQTIFMQAMHLFLDCQSSYDMLAHEYATKETYCWSKVFLDSFLVFWDSATNQEFVLTDNGMTSEYEPSHNIFGGIDLSKFSYLHKQLLNESLTSSQKCQYLDFFSKYQIMYENFNIFSLSSTRCIVLANPFFRLYSGKQLILHKYKEEINFEVPDIWPTCIETREAISIPNTQYISEGLFLEDDIFIYKPCQLTLFDTIYVNVLALNQKKRLLGFNDIDKVIDSLCCANMLNVVNNEDLYCDYGKNSLEKFIEYMLKDDYNYIFEEYKGKKWKISVDPFEYLDSFAYKAWRDIRENKYVLKYLLSNKEMIKTMSNFDFMGSPEQRVKAFELFFYELEKDRKDVINQ